MKEVFGFETHIQGDDGDLLARRDVVHADIVQHFHRDAPFVFSDIAFQTVDVFPVAVNALGGPIRRDGDRLHVQKAEILVPIMHFGFARRDILPRVFVIGDLIKVEFRERIGFHERQRVRVNDIDDIGGV